MEFKEFIEDGGWVVFVALILIIAFVIFKPFGDKENEQTYQEMICANLDNNGSVFKEIPISMQLIDQTLNLKVVNVYANTSKPRMWNEQGVTCQMNVEVCQHEYLFCMNLEMMIPVEYIEWNNWYNKTEG